MFVDRPPACVRLNHGLTVEDDHGFIGGRLSGVAFFGGRFQFLPRSVDFLLLGFQQFPELPFDFQFSGPRLYLVEQEHPVDLACDGIDFIHQVGREDFFPCQIFGP